MGSLNCIYTLVQVRKTTYLKKTTTYHCQWLETHFEPFSSSLGAMMVVEEAVQVV